MHMRSTDLDRPALGVATDIGVPSLSREAHGARPAAAPRTQTTAETRPPAARAPNAATALAARPPPATFSSSCGRALRRKSERPEQTRTTSKSGPTRGHNGASTATTSASVIQVDWALEMAQEVLSATTWRIMPRSAALRARPAGAAATSLATNVGGRPTWRSGARWPPRARCEVK